MKKDQPPQPIPISERLPTEADCDIEGRCWIYENFKHVGSSPMWCLEAIKTAEADGACITHWLPHWAIPVPQEEGR